MAGLNTVGAIKSELIALMWPVNLDIVVQMTKLNALSDALNDSFERYVIYWVFL